MRSRYFDVVVLGRGFEGLLCAALLAKRGFRVLVLGQGELEPTYEIGGRRFPRGPHTFLAAHSPAARKVLAELALNQLFRRRAEQMDPSFQVAMPGHRFDAVLDLPLLERELEREFPSVKRAALEFHRVVERLALDFDPLVERSMQWPPETFFERREFARATAHRVFDRKGDGLNPFSELPSEHPFRRLVGAPVAFAANMDASQLSSLAMVRLYGAWWQGAVKLRGGLSWLSGALAEKITTYSGELRFGERADAILLRRGAAVGVRIAGTAEEIGCGHIVGSVGVRRLAALLPDRAAFGELFERMGEPRPRFLRYTLNVEVPSEAVPPGMGRDVFAVRDPSRPAHAENLLRIQVSPERESGERLLTVQALLPRRGVEEVDRYIDGLRERVLGTLGDVIPFLGNHILSVDSPHDGRDLQDFRKRGSIAAARPWERGPTTMEPVFGFPVRGALGVCAMPVRTPVKRLLLCNRQVVPGLGEEGAFLAAISVARLVARSDGRKEWMRRGLWTKMEV